ncbi:MAG TPA: PadR family transcriptional regulator [Vicinamibacterales bacterium]|nr:PadR family transcriptional regulator [Vicinamibacterales bacterium]
MRRPLRFSHAAQLVLEHFVTLPSRWHHGYALMNALELPSGTLYPVLMRLADAGWLETRWESPARDGRPPRHLYRLAGGAASDARGVLKEWAPRGLNYGDPRTAT